MKWHHIMRFRDDRTDRTDVVDLGECFEGESGDNWFEAHIDILRDRLVSRTFTFSPDSRRP